MLIIEGPDMVGKTTLVPWLQAELRAQLLWLRRPDLAEKVHTVKFGLEEAAYTTAKQWIARAAPWCVADRFHLSETVYGPLGRGYSNLTPDAAADVDAYLDRHGAVTIVVCATEARYEELIRDVYPTRGEAFTQEVCRRVNQAYLALPVRRLGSAWQKLVLAEGFTQTSGGSEDQLRRLVRWYISLQMKIEHGGRPTG